MANRRAQIAQNIRVAPRSSGSGGTTAPPGAAKGHTTGLAPNRKPTNPVGQRQKVPMGGLSAPPQPGAAPPVQPQPPMPWDLAAANDEAGSAKRLSNAVAGLDSQWLLKQQEYGLEGSWADAASNPYSRSALLQRSYDNARRGTTNSSGRQLYAGSHINAQNSNTHHFNRGRDDLQRGYAQEHAQYISGKTQAQDEHREALAQAAWDRVNAGLQAAPEPAPAGAAPQAAPKAAPKAKRKNQPRKQQIRQNISGRKAL